MWVVLWKSEVGKQEKSVSELVFHRGTEGDDTKYAFRPCH